ncbi:probable JmjC domain-containing histone demethylation protein 2C isoform X2 [Liolophura sinensis]|uniref:probable JmjC domain-containing histone demethylation protein 2C isoform X2 n=1 Tax=Liolophura sinensis TaxID=3198878 RepID=UPI003158701D
MGEMAFKSREEVVGKRFLAVRSAGRLKLSKISEWEWLAGVIRAVSCRDSSSSDFSALVEFDDKEWKKREWVRVQETFQVFLVENTLLWAEREDINKPRHQLVNWPALSFKPLVDKFAISGGKRKPVEFLVDRHRGFVEEADTAQYQEGDETQYPAANNYPEVKKAIKSWLDYQDGQQILLTTPTILPGYRVEVYRAEGTTQWYTAVIQSYNSTTKTLAVTDDTVLEEHNEDPSLVQMRFIDDGVVDSILRGVDVGITPRRRPRNSNKEKTPQTYNSTGHYTRQTKAQSPSRAAPPPSRSSITRKSRQRHVSGSSNTDSEKEKVPESAQAKSVAKKERKRKPKEDSEADSEPPSEITVKKNKLSDKRTSAKPVLQESVKERPKPPKARSENFPECRTRDSSLRKQQKDLSRKNRTSGEANVLPVDKNPCASPKEEPRVPPIESPVSPLESKPTEISGKTKSQALEGAASKSIKNIKGNLCVDSETKRKVSGVSGSSGRRTPVHAVAKPKPTSASPVQSEKKVPSSSPPDRPAITENVKKELVKKDVSESSSVESEDMHYKKLHLLARESSKEKPPQSSLSANIDLTRSVTDQLSKLAKSEVQQQSTTSTVNSTDTDTRTSRTATGLVSEPHRNHNRSADYLREGPGRPGETRPCAPQAHVVTSMPNASSTQALEERPASSSSSQERPVSRHSDEKRPGSQFDDLRVVKNSPASSPLIIDRNEPVNPYRDPELMRKNPVHSMLGVPKPIGSSSYPNVHTPIPGPPGTLPVSTTLPNHPLSRTLLPLQYSPQLPALGLPHLSLPRAAAVAQLDPIAAREISSLAQQQQQLALQYQSQHLLQIPSYPATLPGNLTNTQLELLWQQQHPTVPVPPPWMLSKYQDDLIRGTLIREREISEERDRERRIERDRREREIERERLEREKAERERADRERAERERAEKERQDREREKQERCRQEREREQRQEQRILTESVEAAVAVNQHFTESLRLAKQKAAATGVWPSITLGTGKGVSEVPSAHSQPPPAHSGQSFDLKSGDHKDRKIMEERVKQASERESREKEYRHHSYSPHDQGSYSPQERTAFSPHAPRVKFMDKHQELILRQTEEKRLLALEQEKLLRHQRYIHETQQKALITEDKYQPQKPPEAHSKSTVTTTSNQDSKSAHLYAPYPYSYRNNMYVSPTSTTSTSSASNPQSVKPEPNFNLYGYQPFQHSYIPSDKLHLHGLRVAEREGSSSVKDERNRSAYDQHAQGSDGRSTTPLNASKKGNKSSPPPLIKDPGKVHSTVIVDNRSREGGKSGSPHSSHYHQSSPVISGSSRPPTAPGALPDRQPDRPSSSSSTHSSPSSSTLAHHLQSHPMISPVSGMPSHASAFRAAEKSASSRAQSPLHVASPQQLSAAVIRPLEYPKAMQSHSQIVGSSAAGTITSNPNHVPVVASPPAHPSVSVSTSSSHPAYTYSLIQQGLVPNPIYSQSVAVNATKVSDSQAQNAVDKSPTGHSFSGMGAGAVGSSKRKSGKEGSNRKKHRVGSEFTEGLSHSHSVTSQSSSLYSPNPHKVTGGNVHVSPPHHPGSSPITSGTSVLTTSNTNSTTSTTVASTTSPTCITKPSCYMDSFRSFVENTVQIAFFQDQENSKNKAKLKAKVAHEGQQEAGASQKQQSRQQIHHTLQQQLQANPKGSLQPSAHQQSKSQILPHQHVHKQFAPSHGVQQPSYQKYSSQPQSYPLTSDPKPVSCPSPVNLVNTNSNSCSSIMDTINRVANGGIDTDSDTLSAPSPPPQSRTTSPHKSGNHTKLKKAWLQRHSDEDKKEVKLEPSSSPSSSPSASTEDSKPEMVKQCFVNCSYISPKKEGGRVTPITSLQLPNGSVSEGGREDEESTSSASETECQGMEGNPLKRAKNRRRKRNNSAKKSKIENAEGGTAGSKKKIVQVKKEQSEDGSKERHKAKSREAEDYAMENHEDEKPRDQLQESTKKILQEHLKEMAKISSSSKDPEAMGACKSENMETDKLSDSSEKREKKRKRKNKEIPHEDLDKSIENFNRPLVKSSVTILKKTCEPFLQDGSCSEVTPKLMKCRECKMTPSQRSKKLPNIFCRFYAFRRLRYSPKGYLAIAGFSELADAEPDDIRPWIPKVPVMEPLLDIETAKYIIAKVGDKFCELVEQEKEARAWAGDEPKITWKRAVTGVREMCDACDTTLFNIHWVCQKCGFVVCLDCFKVRMQKDTDEEAAFMDAKHNWLRCSANRQPHEPEKLMLTQIIPCSALWELGELIHDIRVKWNISSDCPCGRSKDHKPKNGLVSGSEKKCLMNGLGENRPGKRSKKSADPYLEGFNTNNAALNGNVKSSVPSLTSYNPDTPSPLNLLADVASMDIENNKRLGDGDTKQFTPITDGSADDKKNPAGCSTLRELLTKNAGKMKTGGDNKKKSKVFTSTLDDIIQSVVEKSLPKDSGENTTLKLTNYIPKLRPCIVSHAPIPVQNLTETSVKYPDVPHSWLCDGRLLRLHDPQHKGNFKIFQEQWKRGQPVLVSGVDKLINKKLWRPEAFSKEFGPLENDLVNTRTGLVLVGHKMRDFWDGFEYLGKRVKDNRGEPSLLKLKDWPPGDDFSELLPSRFEDLMRVLPLPEYTHRNGRLNLAARLPDFLVKPDLGPKMYNAYGSASHPTEGTTNLHLDVSDAVNCMMYVGIPGDGPGGRVVHEAAALKSIDDAGCDEITKRRVREVNEVPGALWHIFDARDADKMRDFLNKVGKETGEKIEPHHDPIHDQSWYLDETLRKRLYKEYGVEGYTIIQCMGDAVFIPAGAPHQVRNLHSCIKVAEDFVSPEHLNHCFRLTQEFRHLSDTHSNHEDKLQVKNIIYHAVKDALAILNYYDSEDEDN